MGDEPASSVKAPAQPRDQGAPRRLGWPFAFGWLVLIASVEFGLSWFLPEVGHSLTGPAVVVAGAGLGLGMLGYFVAGHLRDKGRGDVSASVRRALGVGALVLPVLSLGWNLPGTGRALYPVAWGVVGFAVFLVVAEKFFPWRKANEHFPLGTVLVVLGSIVASCYMWTVPNGLAMKFATEDEPRLDQLVTMATRVGAAPGGCTASGRFTPLPSFAKGWHLCTGKGMVEFEAPLSEQFGGYVWTVIYQPGLTYSAAPGDSCVLHLDGSWWELAPLTIDMSCPGGFTFVPGG